jgi:anti-sigma factor RsiW
VTPESPSAGHLLPEEMLDYFDGKLPLDREGIVEEHLADCSECVRLAHQAQAAERVLDQWTAQRHGDALLRTAMARALAQAEREVAQPELRERLRRWRQSWRGVADGALQVFIEHAAQARNVVAKGVEALTRSGSEWHFAPELQPIPVRGAAVTELDSTVMTTPQRQSEGRVRVAVHAGGRGSIVVRLDDLQADRLPPLVVLIGGLADASPSVRFAEVEQEVGSDYFIARFEDLPAGDYLVVLEPPDVGAGDA